QRLADEAAAEAARLAAEAASSAEAQAAADAAAAEAQRLADEAAAVEAQRLANEAAAVEAQRVADEAAAAEAQRLADEAAAVEAQRLADEAAAAEAQRLADEAAAAETQRLADEAAAAAASGEAPVLSTEIPPVLETEVAADGTEVVVVPDVPLEPTVLIDPAATPDVAPEAVATLGTLLAAPTATDPAVTDPAAPAADPAAVVPEVIAAPVAAAAAIPLAPDAAPPADVPAPVVLEQVLTAADTRSSAEEFAAAPAAEPGRRRSGLSDLEKVGLVALGAIVVGAVLNNGNQVVDNTGDRVVVRSTSGQYYVYKDDDALLRRPGSNVRTETYGDGSTRTIVDRGDGTQVVTIRDATGRVLRRATYDSQGREIVLIDDLVEEVRVDVSTLPTPSRTRVTISTSDGDAELKAALARVQAEELGRSFSLRQIREIAEVRALAATVEVNAITFDSGSAAIKASEAEKLADLGGIINDLVALNPGEIFLIEGHTDAVGSASSNLTLSDRRAESVALALTEYFDVPPENLVVQGYGEGELLIPTTGNERANRRVAVKVITPLMRSASLQ
ncbi:MAG: OmpA family protein, partial [Paracoccaceae bacterium]